MVVHSMTTEEMVLEGRHDFPAMRNKLDGILRSTRRAMIKSRQEIGHMVPWRSPRHNQWLLLVHQRKCGPQVFSLLWYYDNHGHINALLMARGGLVFRIDWHVIDRYGQRFDPTATPLERLQGFFFENHHYTVEPTDRRGERGWDVMVGMNQGMGLGSWDQDSELVRIDTFINHGQMFANQLQTMERMDMERTLLNMTPGQRRHFIDLWKRRHPQDIGTPTMEWLEKYAA